MEAYEYAVIMCIKTITSKITSSGTEAASFTSLLTAMVHNSFPE